MNSYVSGRTVRGLVVAAGLSVSAAVIGAATLTPASAGGHHQHVMVGPTGNKVEMVHPSKSKYVPHVAHASARDRAKAEKLLAGVREFCRTHSAADIKKRWRAGEGGKPSQSNHFFNPRPAKRSSGLHPTRPRAALIYEGRLRGVMFVGKPLPYLGSIPRAHGHHNNMPVEMVHVYCTKNLKDAFTPNRMLGINADMIDLRWKIRPAVMDLSERQLRAVRDKIRGYIGNKYATTPDKTSGKSGPDPVLEAMRTEIRQSVWDLTEGELRSVWRLMQSYRK